MTSTQLKQEHLKILEYIDGGLYAMAFKALVPWLSELSEWMADEELQQLRMLYSNMLHYAIQGVDDPQRDELTRQLEARLYALTDHVWMRLMSEVSHDFLFEEKRLRPVSDFRWDLAVETVKQELSEQTAVGYSEALDILFDSVWLSDALTPKMEEDIRMLFELNEKQSIAASVVVSALTLSLLGAYDVTRLMTLLKATECTCRMIQLRAEVGLVLIAIQYKDRRDLVRLISRLLSLRSNEADYSRIFCALMQTAETPRYTQKIKNEMMPKFRSVAFPFRQKLNKLSVDEDNIDQIQEALAESGLDSTIQQMTEMAMHGKDIYEETLAPLRRTPFFNTISHWLVPFYSLHPQAQILGADSESAAVIGVNNTLCDSDKYALTVLLNSLPKGQNENAVTALHIDASQIKELKLSENADRQARDDVFTVVNYIRDLYRLFSLHVGAKGYKSVLAKSFRFTSSPLFCEFLPSPENREQMASFMIKLKHFDEAYPILTDLLNKKQLQPTHRHYYQLGVCASQRNDWNTAVKYLTAALDLDEHSVASRRLLANAFEHLGDYEQAIGHYEKIYGEHPDLPTMLKIVSIYMIRGEFDVALEKAQKVLYEMPDSQEMNRLAIRCAIESGHVDAAMRYCNTLLEHPEKNVSDTILAAHFMLFLDNLDESMKLYRQARKQQGNDDHFVELFRHSQELFIRMGMSPEQMQTILNFILLDN